MDHLSSAVLARSLRRDPIPIDPETGEPDKLVQVEVVSRSGSVVLPNGNVVHAGSTVVEIYSSQLAAVEALVDMSTDAEIAEVRRHYDWHVKESKNRDATDLPRYRPSMAASYRAVMHHDQSPLISARVIDPAPKVRSTKG